MTSEYAQSLLSQASNDLPYLSNQIDCGDESGALETLESVIGKLKSVEKAIRECKFDW